MIWQIQNSGYIPIAIALISMPIVPAISLWHRSEKAAIAQSNDLNLAVGFKQTSAILTGTTGGSYSFASIANRDRNGNPCMGYGAPKPDHTIILEDDFDQLRVQVNSGGKDTTLVIIGPDNRNIRCGFGQKIDKDASVIDSGWQAGRYDIWVGSIKPNQRSNYSLSIHQ